MVSEGVSMGKELLSSFIPIDTTDITSEKKLVHLLKRSGRIIAILD